MSDQRSEPQMLFDPIDDGMIVFRQPSMKLTTDREGVCFAANHVSIDKGSASCRITDKAIYFGYEPGPGLTMGCVVAMTCCLMLPCILVGNYPGFVVRKVGNEVLVDLINRQCTDSQPAKTLRHVIGAEEFHSTPELVESFSLLESGQRRDVSYYKYRAFIKFHRRDPVTLVTKVTTFKGIFIRCLNAIKTFELVPGRYFGTMSGAQYTCPETPKFPNINKIVSKINILCYKVHPEVTRELLDRISPGVIYDEEPESNSGLQQSSSSSLRYPLNQIAIIPPPFYQQLAQAPYTVPVAPPHVLIAEVPTAAYDLYPAPSAPPKDVGNTVVAHHGAQHPSNPSKPLMSSGHATVVYQGAAPSAPPKDAGNSTVFHQGPTARSNGHATVVYHRAAPSAPPMGHATAVYEGAVASAPPMSDGHTTDAYDVFDPVYPVEGQVVSIEMIR